MFPAIPSWRVAPSFVILATIMLSACAVGPDFERPPAPNVQSYEPTPLPEKTIAVNTPGGAAQAFIPDGVIPAEWWKLFHSEPLNRLIARSLQANPDLAAAEAALREAHENAAAGYGLLLPSVDSGFNVTRQRVPGAVSGGTGSPPPFTVYNASVSVSYGLDVFGGARRYIEALTAAEEFQAFELEAARLSLTGNVVTTAIREASLRAQIAATRRIIDDEKQSLDLLQKQFDLGAIAKSPVLAQAATLAQTRATLPPLEKDLAQTRHLLSVLAGQLPSVAPEGKFELASLTLPKKLPVSVPSRLVEQRPDIRAAEASLHAASAEIGVATANMLPQFDITGDIGTVATALSGLGGPASLIWSLAGGITQPLFHGGELLHRRRASEAAFDQAAAVYRKTVLTAFQDVADSLRALQSDAEALKASAEAERAARESLNLSRQQYKEGAISYLSLLDAQRTAQQAKIALVQAQAQRYADTAALFTALGGGWWNRAEAVEPSISPGEGTQPDPGSPVDLRAQKNDGADTAPVKIVNFNLKNNSAGE
ncbi:MAG: efflux transporter outer membrane subunit [Bdellovibrionales bacterium]